MKYPSQFRGLTGHFIYHQRGKLLDLVRSLLLVLLATGYCRAIPVITSMSPSTARPGATVTITGSGFNSSATGNVVYFGPTRATVSSASATSLMVIVPFGATYAPVSVCNTAEARTAYSSLPFTPVFNTAPYKAALNIPDKLVHPDLSNSILGISTGDLDGDGKADMIVCGSSALKVYRNVGDSNALAPSSFPASFSITATNFKRIIVADMDGDGKLDIIGANSSSDGITVYRNKYISGTMSGASFEATYIPMNYLSTLTCMTAGDLDGDGRMDIVLSGFGSNRLHMFHNTSTAGNISMDTSSLFVTPSFGTYGIAIADLDGDAKPEIATTNSAGNAFYIFKNIAVPGTLDASSFAPLFEMTGYSTMKGISINDIDVDGLPDIVITNSNSSSISIYRNIGGTDAFSNSYFARTDVNILAASGTAVVADLNGDGRPDISNIFEGGGNVPFLMNNTTPGNISAAAFTQFKLANIVTYDIVVVGDLDNDMQPDIISAENSSITIMKNRMLFEPPVVDDIDPVFAAPGTEVLITGNYFDTIPANDRVMFGPVRATVTEATQTRLKVIVPAGATYGPVTISNLPKFVTCESRMSFLPVFENRGCIAPMTYSLTATIDIPHEAGSVTTGDLDADGRPDLVIGEGNVSGNSLYLVKNISSVGNITPSSFGAKIALPRQSGSNSSMTVKIADLNGDSKPDIVATGPSNLYLFTNKGAGPLSAGSFKTLQVSLSNLTDVTIADIDTNGLPDVLPAISSGGTFNFFKNAMRNVGDTFSQASFTNVFGFSGGSASTKLAVGDIDKDGQPDVVMTDYYLNRIAVFKNKFTGLPNTEFAIFDNGNPVRFSTGPLPDHVMLRDIDGDGDPDIIVANSNANTISILRNKFTANIIDANTFAPAVNISLGVIPEKIEIADIDGDGRPEILATEKNGSHFYIIRNNCVPGTIDQALFDAPVSYITEAGATNKEITVTDLDGDGIQEILVAGGASNKIYIFRSSKIRTVPYISTVTPAVADSGTTVMISGGNFSNGATNNTVYFGATKAEVVSASSGAITVKVPAGATHAPLSLNDATLSLNMTAPISFLPTFDKGELIDTINFAAKIDLSTADHTNGVAIKDIDGDGKPDVLTAARTSLSLVRNIADNGSLSASSFEARIDIADTTILAGATMADIDGDGKADAVVAARNSISIFRNTASSGSFSAGTMAAPVSFPVSGSPVITAIEDLDGDGRNDIVLSDNGTAIVSIYHNISATGAINMAPVQQIRLTTPSSNPVYTAIGDMDGDGKGDIVFTDQGRNVVSVLRNRSQTGYVGARSFAGRVDIATGSGPRSLALSDINGDGRTDIVVANYTGQSVSVLRNMATAGSITAGSFAPKVDLNAGTACEYVAISDLNGDGKPDIAVTTPQAHGLSFLKNNISGGIINSGSFADHLDLSLGSDHTPGPLAIGDLDADGMPDIAVTAQDQNYISILKNIMYTLSLDTITGSSRLCMGIPAMFSIGETGGAWSSSNSAVATVSSGGVVTAAATGMATISYTKGALYTVKTITVIASPASITGVPSVNINATATLANATGGGVWTSGNMTVVTVNATSGTYRGIEGGIASVSYTLTSGCYAVKAVTVNSIPSADTSSLCIGGTIQLNNYQGAGAWSSNNPSVATVDASGGVVTGLSSGVAYMTFTPVIGTPSTRKVTIYAPPGSITSTAGNQVCAGSNITLTSANIYGGTWSSSSTATGTVGYTSGILSGINAGTTVIRYRSSISGCSTETVVTVNAMLNAISGNRSVCSGSTSQLGNTTPGGIWSSSNTTYGSVTPAGVVTGGIVTGVSQRTVTITYKHPGGCQTTAEVTINALPAAIGTIPVICVNSNDTLTRPVSGGMWNSTNGSGSVSIEAVSGAITGLTPGTATISYTFGTGCASTRIATVNAAMAPIVATANPCVGASTKLTIVAGVGVWSSGNTGIATIVSGNGMLTGVSAGSVGITYKIPGGCKATTIVTVNTAPGNITGTTNVCVDATVALSSTGPGIWSSSDNNIGTVDASGIVTGKGGGTISITRSNGSCYKSIAVTVKPLPNNINGSAVLCAGGAPATLTVSGAVGAWSSSNTSIANIGPSSGIVSGSAPGSVTITYTATSGCRRTKAIVVSAIASAGTISGPSAVIAGNTIALVSDGVTGGTWSSSNIGRATVNAATGIVTGISAGAVNISYTVNNGCGSATSMYPVTVTTSRPSVSGSNSNGGNAHFIDIYPNPTAGRFSANTSVAGTLVVYTLEGKLVAEYVLQQGIAQLELNNDMAPGVYMCRFSGVDGSVTAVRLILEQ